MQLFFANANKAVDTPAGGTLQAMEDYGVVASSAATRLSIDPYENALSYPKGKAQGKTTNLRLPQSGC